MCDAYLTTMRCRERCISVLTQNWYGALTAPRMVNVSLQISMRVVSFDERRNTKSIPIHFIRDFLDFILNNYFSVVPIICWVLACTAFKDFIVVVVGCRCCICFLSAGMPASQLKYIYIYPSSEASYPLYTGNEMAL